MSQAGIDQGAFTSPSTPSFSQSLLAGPQLSAPQTPLVPGMEPCTASNPMGMGDPSHGQVMTAAPESPKPPKKKKCPSCDAAEAKRQENTKACLKGVGGSAAIGAGGGAIAGAATGPGAALGALGGGVAGGGIAYYTLPECGPGDGSKAWYQSW
jgi:hypothetical protein